jgi:TetR/AcrR family transcriptional regulator, mexJK operon transcriptional repressor
MTRKAAKKSMTRKAAAKRNSMRRTAAKQTSTRGRPPAGQVLLREQRLLDVATEVFLECGFKRASMDEIARRAGASKQTLYARYPSKSALFEAIVERKSGQIFEAIGPLSEEAPLRETLIRFAVTLLDMILTPDARGLHRVVIAECVEFPELGELFWKLGPGRMHARLAEYMERQRASGAIQCESCMRAVESLIGLLVSPILLRTNLGLPTPHTRSQAERAAWASHTVDTFLRSVRNEAGTGSHATTHAGHSPTMQPAS